jgi:hypothetical protein
MAKTRQARRCTARKTNGEPCAAWAMRGATVCRVHGGSARQVRAAATERLALDVANRLAIPVTTTASDALQDALDRVNGQVIYLAELVSKLTPEELVWGTVQRRVHTRQGPEGESGGASMVATQGERPHPYWVAMNEAIARRSQIAEAMTKLGIADRQAHVLEVVGARLANGLDLALDGAGISLSQKARVLQLLPAALGTDGGESGDR